MGKCWCTNCEKYVEYKLNRESKDYILDDGKTLTKFEFVRPTCLECGNYVDIDSKNPNEKVDIPEKIKFELSKPEASMIYKALKSYVLYSGSFVTDFEKSVKDLYDPLLQVEFSNRTYIEIDTFQAEHIMFALRNFRITCAYFYDDFKDGRFQEIFHSEFCVIRRLSSMLNMGNWFEDCVTI